MARSACPRNQERGSQPSTASTSRSGLPLNQARRSGSVRTDSTRSVRRRAWAKPAQIARYSPDWRTLAVTSLNSDTVSLIDPSFREQTAIKVGSQPMDMAYRGNELFVACQGDGSVHVIDIPGKRWKQSFQAGTGCESLGFF